MSGEHQDPWPHAIPTISAPNRSCPESQNTGPRSPGPYHLLPTEILTFHNQVLCASSRVVSWCQPLEAGPGAPASICTCCPMVGKDAQPVWVLPSASHYFRYHSHLAPLSALLPITQMPPAPVELLALMSDLSILEKMVPEGEAALEVENVHEYWTRLKRILVRPFPAYHS